MTDYRKMKKEELIGMLESLMSAIRASGDQDIEESRRLLQELQVHQIELEMQNRELRETQGQLEDARNRYADLYDFSPVGYVSLDEKGVIREINLTGASMLGHERSRVIGRPFRFYLERACIRDFEEHLRHCMATKEKAETELVISADSAGHVHIEMITMPYGDYEKKKVVFRAALIDITERMKAEKRVRQLSSAIEQSPNMVMVLDTAGRIEYVNRRFSETTGYARDEVLAKDPSFLVSDRHPAEFYRGLWETVLSGRIWRGDMCATKKNGELFWRLVAITPVKDRKNNISHFVAVEIDDTERKNAEKELASEKERLSATLRSVGEGVITLDDRDTVYYFNDIAEKLTGLTQRQAFGRPISEVFELFDKNNHVPYVNPVDRLQASRNEEYLLLKDKYGTYRLITGTVTPIIGKEGKTSGKVLVFSDATERKRLEEESIKAKRLESLQVLAGGVAHDFNNLLTTIIGDIELTSEEIPHDSESFRRLGDARKATFRAKSLSQQLLTFSAGGAPVTKKRVSVEDIIEEALAYSLTRPDIECGTSFQKGLRAVEADEGQLVQVFSNLLINAEHAMPRGGTISILCENTEVTGEELQPLKKGSYVRVTIRDTGLGIPMDCLAKIFDPFFTTKDSGCGLGLAIASLIIQNHGGHITVESEPNAGSTFRVYLPSMEGKPIEEKAEEGPRQEKAAVDRAFASGGGKVLLMDDEILLRNTAGETLALSGYKVEFARDGSEAIELYKKALCEGSPFSAVILDLTVPGGMGGKEAIEKLRDIDPSVKAIVSSGYSFDPILSEYSKYGFTGVILKPYSVSDLRKTLKKILKDGTSEK